MATLPPIPNIEDLMDLDIYQPGNNPEPPNNPPNPPKPNTPDPNPPGPNPPDGPGPNPPNPPNPNQFNPNTQLQRDIFGVRQAVQRQSFKDEMNRSLIPDWNLQLPESPEPSDEELGEWESLLIGFGAELLMYSAAVLVPNEYLQQIQSGMARVFSTLGQIAKYFGYEKRVNQIANLLKRTHTKINDPRVVKWNNRLSAVLDGLSPNIGMKMIEKLAFKLFPGASSEIKVFLNAFSISQFILDPFGTLKAIINAAVALFSKVVPDPKDVMEILIADPLKWIL